MGQSSRGSTGWIGWLIFILIVFGSRFLPPLANWLSQVTGLPVTMPMLIGGLVILIVVISLGSSLMRQVDRARSTSDTRLPTTLSPPSSRATRLDAPSRSMQLPPTSSGLPRPRLPSGEQRLPSPPRYEPIIDPRILAFGIIGLLFLGGFFLLLLLFAGSTP